MSTIPFLEPIFALEENHTTVRRELLGGLTTFLTMAYIIVVNPQILSQAGIPAEGVVFATCLASAAATLVMGFYANYPIALAPGMSLNAYFTYTVCLGMHVRWPMALGAVFLSGVLFVLLTVTRVREQIVNGIPYGLKHATAGGIGMFIAFVGLRSAKLVVANPATFVSLGNFADHQVQAACLGIVLTLVLMVRRVNGAILLGILGTTLYRHCSRIVALAFITACISASVLHFFKAGHQRRAAPGPGRNHFHFSVCGSVRQRRHDGRRLRTRRLPAGRKNPSRGRALLADGIGTIFGAVTGTSTVTSYIESAAGVAAGARTGLSNVMVAALFLVAMFFSPVASAIPAFATAPALILVGALMTESVAQVEWKDFSEHFRHSSR